MDLRLISIPASKSVSGSKFYKDKRRVVIDSKALLNTIITKNQIADYGDIYIPYVIVMGFEIHLCFLFFLENQEALYYKKV